MADVREPLHVVVLPWLAFGHLLPFLQLSKSLARRGHRVSFLSTPRNLQRLPRLPTTLSHLITFVELPFPSAGTALPPGAEATSDIHPANNGHLKAAFDALEAPFLAFLDSANPPPDWVIHDFSAHWMPRVAVPRRLPCAFFSVFPPSAMAFFGPPAELIGNVPGIGRLWKRPEDLTVPPPWIASAQESSAIAYRLHEARRFFLAFRENSSGVSDAQRIGWTLDAVQVVVMRSCPEVDGPWLRLLGDLYSKPVLPAGFLPPPAVQEGAGKASTTITFPGADIFEWLDRQAPSSILYVALGSEAVISVDLFHELARGLDLSRLPFLWALRRPTGLPPDMELLPEGFEARTAGRGVVAKGWVPQPEVLAHPAVGGFLTHCGWSSLVEGLCHGRPLVMLPVFVDQGLNARLMEARGCGVEVPRGDDDGGFTGEGVAETARLVVVDEAGEEVRAAARRAGEVFGDQALQEKCEDELARYLVHYKASAPGGPTFPNSRRVRNHVAPPISLGGL